MDCESYDQGFSDGMVQVARWILDVSKHRSTREICEKVIAENSPQKSEAEKFFDKLGIQVRIDPTLNPDEWYLVCCSDE